MNMTTRDKQIAEAVVEAAARIHDAEAAAQGFSPFSNKPFHKHYAEKMRSLDLGAIIASVTEVEPSGAQCHNYPDDHRDLVVTEKEVSCIDCGDSWPINTPQSAAPVATAQHAEQWHRLVILLGCMFGFDGSGSIEEVAASAREVADRAATAQAPVEKFWHANGSPNHAALDRYRAAQAPAGQQEYALLQRLHAKLTERRNNLPAYEHDVFNKAINTVEREMLALGKNLAAPLSPPHPVAAVSPDVLKVARDALCSARDALGHPDNIAVCEKAIAEIDADIQSTKGEGNV